MSDEVDTSTWERIQKAVASLAEKQVRVGIIGSKAAEEHKETKGSGDADGDGPGLTNVEIAIIHEFGTSLVWLHPIPARPFVSGAMKQAKAIAELEQLNAKAAAAVMSGKMTAETALGLIGAWGKGTVQDYVTKQDIPPPLAPATIEAKGSTKPLVDTGQLVGAVDWEIK